MLAIFSLLCFLPGCCWLYVADFFVHVYVFICSDSDCCHYNFATELKIWVFKHNLVDDTTTLLPIRPLCVNCDAQNRGPRVGTNKRKHRLPAFWFKSGVESLSSGWKSQKTWLSYKILFQFKPTSYPTGTTNLFHLTRGGNGDVYGDRAPAVFFHHSKGLQFASAVKRARGGGSRTARVRPTRRRGV